MTTHDQQRLDQMLVAQGHFATRSRARDAIARGTVRIDGKPVTKPGQAVSASAAIEIDDPAQAYVSRAALKLIAGLDHFGFSPDGLDCLDIGASTGGFTQVLLERGARHVTAVDVGHDQLHQSLAGHARITNLEGLNARELDATHVGGRPISAVVSDVSFISLKLALPPACVAGGARRLLCAAGQAAIRGGPRGDRKGRYPEGRLRRRAHCRRHGRMAGDAARLDTHRHHRLSHFGGDGNHEYLLGGRKA